MSAFAHQSNLSFVVVDPTSNSIVGGDFLFNYLDGVECVEHHHCMQPIVDLLRAVEAPARDRLEANGGLRVLDDLGTSSEIVRRFQLTLAVSESAMQPAGNLANLGAPVPETVSKCQTTLVVSEIDRKRVTILAV